MFTATLTCLRTDNLREKLMRERGTNMRERCLRYSFILDKSSLDVLTLNSSSTQVLLVLVLRAVLNESKFASIFPIQSMSRFTGLQFTGLPCLPVFFFRATPSPRFTGGMPVYRGGSFFHARGAPPTAAHSHTRCCTQHNTARWVLRAAANTCLHTMPCAAGELCHLRKAKMDFIHARSSKPAVQADIRAMFSDS